MEGGDEAHTSAKRKIGHLKISRRALGRCAMHQMSGFPLQVDVLKLGNEILAVSGTHSKEKNIWVSLSSPAAPACLGPKAPGICLITFPNACEGHCVLSKNKGDFQMRTVTAKH